MPKKKPTATRKAAAAKKTATKKKTTTTAKKSRVTNKKRQIGSIKHKDKRVNIPTEELRDFVSDDENTPQIMLYPRDPSLDPQLVWKGKDEQDSQDLEVPIVPIYIQEKIHPQVIIEHLKTRTKQDDEQFALFDDFNGIEDFEKKIDFYHHESNWTNRMILGDSLLVMNGLSEKEGLKGRIQSIYFDPPYAVQFKSNWQVSTRKREVKDSPADVSRQPEQVRAYRDTWQLGVHSYLAYLRDRLMVARDLLVESGSIFLQINSENSHLVACLMDEVFGSENFIANIIFRKKSLPLGAKHLETMHDHILFYCKNKEQVKYRQLFEENDVSQISEHGPYAFYPDGSFDKIDVSEFRSTAHPKGTKYYRLFSLIAPSYSANTDFDYEFEGISYPPPSGGSWVVNREKLDILARIGRLQPEGKSLSYRLFFDDFPYKKITNFWLHTAMSYKKIYAVQTSESIIEKCIQISTDPGDLVFDPTCGSGTTAWSAEKWGRRWITVDTSRVALALARSRLMTAKFPYFYLSDSSDGIAKEAALSGKIPPPHSCDNDIKKGFVNKRVPQIKLKYIANNPDIKPTMSLKELDVAIARHSDLKEIYDQPYENNKKIRVTGPFTVESLSPHRVLAAEDRASGSEENAGSDASNNFGNIIIENLRKAGVQNTVKNERLKFDWLDTFAGTWIHATGEFTDKDGKTKRIAVSIGPEHGTVSPQHVKEAAKEAVQGVGYDVLIVCGFAFDPHVSEEAKRYGQLTVLPTRMNPDLAMGDELLKKTGAGNLFMIFGEPDLKVTKEKDGNISVELLGVDVYDPTTGEIRSSSTDDIACWFIDTEYNGESFFVRHAYFTGGDKPYEKLKKALKAEINEEAWETLYSTTSRPFPNPPTGKIAVKVINHYGDEVLKVYEI